MSVLSFLLGPGPQRIGPANSRVAKSFPPPICSTQAHETALGFRKKNLSQGTERVACRNTTSCSTYLISGTPIASTVGVSFWGGGGWLLGLAPGSLCGPHGADGRKKRGGAGRADSSRATGADQGRIVSASWAGQINATRPNFAFDQPAPVRQIQRVLPLCSWVSQEHQKTRTRQGPVFLCLYAEG